MSLQLLSNLSATCTLLCCCTDGWKTKKVRMRKLEEAAVGMESLANSFGHTGAALEGRLSMDDLREGQLLTGTVVAQMLSHGIRVRDELHWRSGAGQAEWQGQGQAVVCQGEAAAQLDMHPHHTTPHHTSHQPSQTLHSGLR